MDRVLDCEILRRFGVEVELNTSDGVVVTLDEQRQQIPKGAEYVAWLIKQTLHKSVEIRCWQYYHNSDMWLVKPDSSCGIEVCTPILNGWAGLKSLLQVIQAFKNSGKITADKRCSLHVHVNIADLTEEQLGTVLAYYIKCEHLIFDSIPVHRKASRYCQFVGMTDMFRHDTPMDAAFIIRKLSDFKYYSVNTFHFMKGGGFSTNNDRRPTIEFRVAENEACLDPLFTKNWVRFLLHFVEVTKDLPMPKPYCEDDRHTGLLWLDPKDMFKLLKFDQPLSSGLQQVRDWFLARVFENGVGCDSPCIFSDVVRASSRSQFFEIAHEIVKDSCEIYGDPIFGEKYIR